MRRSAARSRGGRRAPASRQTFLAAGVEPLAHPRHAGAGVGDAVDDHQTVEADAHAAEDAARLAAGCRAGGDLAVREQHGGHRLALVGLDGLAVEEDADAWTAFELRPERKPRQGETPPSRSGRSTGWRARSAAPVAGPRRRAARRR